MELNFATLKEKVKTKSSKPLSHSCNSPTHICFDKVFRVILHLLGHWGINVPLHSRPQST